MSDVLIYHPGTGAQVVVPEEAMPHYRLSGWLLQSEHDANQAAAAEAKEPAADKPATKTSKTG